MTVSLNILNKTNYRIGKKFLDNIARSIIKKCNIKSKKIVIDLNFVSNKEIARLNKKYRRTDKPTDVLSFSYVGNKEFITSPSGILYLGEILIASDIVKKNAQKYKISARQEMSRILIHGVLHLLGYEHAKSQKKAAEMKSLEDEIYRNL